MQNQDPPKFLHNIQICYCYLFHIMQKEYQYLTFKIQDEPNIENQYSR